MAQLHTVRVKKITKRDYGGNFCTAADELGIQRAPQEVRVFLNGLVSQHGTIGVPWGWTLVWPSDSDQKFGIQAAVPITATETSFSCGIAAFVVCVCPSAI